ncbi:MAG: trypsin-like peptidase domain-containing protein [Clostridia bacterium]|nr:trypsin-like peptidase domain-containing protein [Clostridia bacterium]
MNNEEITEKNAEPTEDVNTETEPETDCADVSAEAPQDAQPQSPETVWDFDRQFREDLKAEKKKNRKALAVYAAIVSALFLISLAALGILIVQTAIAASKPIVVEKEIFVREYDPDSGVLTVQEIAAKVIPSTVGISSKKTGGTSIGTGIIYSKDGYIVTNCHVVNGSTEITVYMSDGRTFDAELVGLDDVSDIAVVKIQPVDDIVPAEFGNSDDLIAGDNVVAVGNPAGLEFSGTLTAGIVSSISREISIYSSNGLLEKKMTLIQNSAAIYPGNSGGPLIDVYGKVVGINTMRFSNEDYAGIGFAIPINGAVPVITEIIETGSYSGNNPVAVRGVSLGITGRAVVKDEAVQINETTTFTPGASGVMVVSVIGEESSAYGILEEYDIITEINGKKVSDVYEIREIIAGFAPGESIGLKVFRDGKTLDLKIVFK